MQFYIFCVILFLVFFNAESKVTEEEYGMMPPLFHIDDFDRCLMLGEKMLFCSVTVQLAPLDNYSKVWAIIEDVISHEKNFRHDKLRHSICVPSHCSEIGINASSYLNNESYLQQAISECYTNKYRDKGLVSNVIEIHCENDKSPYEIDFYDIVVGACLLGLLVILVFASFYEGLARYKPKEKYNNIIGSKWGRIITCFSIIKNFDRLKTKNTGSDAKELQAINGMRVYTIFLVVFTHTCMIAFATYSSNPQYEETMTNDPFNMIFINGNYSMQTFILMSSMLLSYHFFLSLEKMKTFKFSYIALAMFNRYIRLTPCLIVIVVLNATWLRHLNRGPLWDKTVGDEFRNCRKNWWTNLLYINNYYDVKHMCLLQTWYLAADTQLYVFSLLVLTIIWKRRKHTMTILCTCLIVGTLIPIVIAYVYNYDILIREYPETMYKILLELPEWTKMLIPGHVNIGGCSIGLIGGYFIYKNRGKKITLKKRFIALWWVLIWGLPLSTVFLGIPMYSDDFVRTRLGAALYQGISRNAYAIGLCLAILGINKNIGWFLRDAVLWSPLQILGRLTYCVFLVHIALIRVRSGQARSLTYMSSYTFVAEAISDFVLSHIFALLLCLAVEMPVSGLQNMIMSRFQKEIKNGLEKSNPEKIINDYFDKSEITKV